MILITVLFNWLKLQTGISSSSLCLTPMLWGFGSGVAEQRGHFVAAILHNLRVKRGFCFDRAPRQHGAGMSTGAAASEPNAHFTTISCQSLTVHLITLTH